jgi:hypothetical protein
MHDGELLMLMTALAVTEGVAPAVGTMSNVTSWANDSGVPPAFTGVCPAMVTDRAISNTRTRMPKPAWRVARLITAGLLASEEEAFIGFLYASYLS